MDTVGRHATVITDIKLKRLLRLREETLSEIQRRQLNPNETCEEILKCIQRTPDRLAPDVSKIKVFEEFR